MGTCQLAGVPLHRELRPWLETLGRRGARRVFVTHGDLNCLDPPGSLATEVRPRVRLSGSMLIAMHFALCFFQKFS